MTNQEIVLAAFDKLGGTVHHNKALISAISDMFSISKVAATELVELAISDGVLSMNSIGELRRGPAA